MVCSRRSLNYFATIFIFFILGNGFTHATVHTILNGPRVTTWGDWGDFEYCPDNTSVIGFRLKTEAPHAGQDETALNGISFRCGFNSSSAIKNITSSVGNWGSWGNSSDCEDGNYAIGYQLRAESPQVADGGDETAANNLRIVCSNWSTPSNTTILEGDGLSWGNWTDLMVCPTQTAICGIQTRVESPQGGGEDNTGLNDLNVACCTEANL